MRSRQPPPSCSRASPQGTTRTLSGARLPTNPACHAMSARSHRTLGRPRDDVDRNEHPREASMIQRPIETRSSAAVRLVREGPVPRATCPHCAGEIELSTVGTRWQVRNPADIADRLVVQIGTLERGETQVMLLNANHVVIDQQRVYAGNVSASVVRVGELFTEAVRRQAKAILIVHNHPSGDPTPSPNDLHLTAEAIAAGRLLDIELLDHLVIGHDAFVSLRERGVAFGRTPGPL